MIINLGNKNVNMLTKIMSVEYTTVAQFDILLIMTFVGIKNRNEI